MNKFSIIILFIRLLFVGFYRFFFEFILHFIVFLLILTGCNGLDFGPGMSVGPYKYPDQPYYVKEDAKVMGHKDKNIFAPDPYDVEYHCSICHYVY